MPHAPVFFLLGIALIVFLRITASDNPFCVFKVVLGDFKKNVFHRNRSIVTKILNIM